MEKKIKTSYVLKTPWMAVRKDTYRSLQGKKPDDYYIVERPDFVVIVPQNKKGELIFVHQYRHGARKALLNFPMGFVEKNEKPLDAAHRELREEIGSIEGKFKFLGSFFLSPSIMKVRGYVFLASHVVCQKNSVNPDVMEITYGIKRLRKDKIEDLLKGYQKTDFVTACAYLLFHKK